MKYFVLFLISLIQNYNWIECLDNGLARTPPMGWMSWERFRCITDCKNYPNECISEDLYTSMADVMATEGYRDAGYEYVIIDDCWMEKTRDPVTDKLVADRERFPKGLNYVADRIHENGLKFGLYEDYGTHTCAGYPGVINHMELDAQTFADWDVDYVKLDGCYAELKDMDEGYPAFGRFLNKTKRPMVYSCSWPVYQEYGGIMPNYESLKEHCNLWRNWGDIDDSWGSVLAIAKYFSQNQDRIQPHAGPGHWNDPDMLIIGNYGLSYDQSKAQMAIWAILAAPLIMSNDLRTMKPEFKEILLNREVIKVDQDPLGIQGKMIKTIKNIEVWVRPISPMVNENYSYAVAFVSLRTDGHPYPIDLKLSDIGLTNKNGYVMRNLYDAVVPELNVYPDSALRVRVIPNGVEFYKFIAN